MYFLSIGGKPLNYTQAKSEHHGAFYGNLGGRLANLEIDLRHLVESFGGQESHMRCPGSILVNKESI